MLIGSSTNVYASLGSISTDTIGGFKNYIFIIAGVILAFYIIERLASAIFPKSYYGDNLKKDV